MNKWNVCRTVSVLILGALPLSARAAAQSVDLDQGLNIQALAQELRESGKSDAPIPSKGAAQASLKASYHDWSREAARRLEDALFSLRRGDSDAALHEIDRARELIESFRYGGGARGGRGRRGGYNDPYAQCGGANAYGTYYMGGGCNAYGCWRIDGGCNAYGCWREGGGCNAYGCWQYGGKCDAYGCFPKWSGESEECVDRR